MENKKNTLGDTLTGTGREHIPNVFFRMMTFVMQLADAFRNYSNKNFKTLGLAPGQIVVDYGCGPARYIKNASETVGPKGKVYAVDIHPMAIKIVNEKIKKYNLKNVEAFLANGYSCAIKDKSADVVYALDMFHMIENPTELLAELARIVKPKGIVIIEDGHQSRAKTIDKIEESNIFTVFQQNKYHVVCTVKEIKPLSN